LTHRAIRGTGILLSYRVKLYNKYKNILDKYIKKIYTKISMEDIMKKNIIVVFMFGLVIISSYAQNTPFIGYDKAPWGSSVDAVRRTYQIGENITLTIDESDPNLQYLLQTNVSSSIKERKFYFLNDKLYRVWVMYYDASDSALIALRNALQNRYGVPSEYDANSSIDSFNVYFDHYSFNKFVPDIEVALLRLYRNSDLRICYTWKRFRDEYQRSKIDL
jgi:hypothetical protein